MDDVVRALLIYASPWAVLLIVLLIVFINIEKAERLWGWLLGLVAWAGTSVRRRSIRAAIQGDINEFSRAVDGEVRGLMPSNMRLEFVKEMDQAELLRNKGVVVVRIRDRLRDEKNIVHAALAFCPAGLLVQARPFLGKPLALAIDITVTRKLLNRHKYHSALRYLYEEVLPEVKEGTAEIEKFCAAFDYLDEHGLFTRVILAEFLDFGARISTKYPQPEHEAEACGFVEYVHAVAKREPGERMVEPGYQGRYISTAFVLIGDKEKIRQEGPTPYLDHLRWLRNHDFEKALLTARDQRIDTAERVSYLAERARLARRGSATLYQAHDTHGKNRKHVLIEMAIMGKV